MSNFPSPTGWLPAPWPRVLTQPGDVEKARGPGAVLFCVCSASPWQAQARLGWSDRGCNAASCIKLAPSCRPHMPGLSRTGPPEKPESESDSEGRGCCGGIAGAHPSEFPEQNKGFVSRCIIRAGHASGLRQLPACECRAVTVRTVTAGH